MNTTAMNPMHFIHTAGVSNFVSGVQTGMIAPTQAFAGFRAVGQAIDTYSEIRPIASLVHLRTSISGLPERDIEPRAQEGILGLLMTHHVDVDRVVRFAVRASEIGVAKAAGLEAPFDLDAQWRWVPEGEFKMGSAKDDPYRYDDEKFLETTMTGGFFMLDHPVTNAEFRVFLDAIGRKDVRDLERKFAGDRQPAVEVSHEEATAYSHWFGEKIAKSMGIPVIGRLPLEAEWEKAAKGPDGNEFTSPATSEQAHFDAKATRDVDHPNAYANGYGLKDMIGNVWEWTSSPWEKGSENFVLRGGSWVNDDPRLLRAAYRLNSHPDLRNGSIGFRPVLVPQDSGK